MGMITDKYGIRNKARPGFTWCAICLCLGLLLTGKSIAQAEPAGDDLQIQSTPGKLLGEQQAAHYEDLLSPDQQISWEVYIPANDTSETPGLLVYISPLASGRIDSRWRSVMDQQNMIYIAANESGNQVSTARRMVLATLGVRALAKQFSFDRNRINVAGFSGGGRVASRLASQYPQAFSGALYICGVDFWKKSQTPDVERVIQNRFVFLTGSKDFNRRETHQVRQQYIKAGAEHTKLMIVPGLAHAHPDASAMTEALQFLSGQD